MDIRHSDDLPNDIRHRTFAAFASTREKIVFFLKFLTSQSYREHTGIPWIQWTIKSNWERIKQEFDKSEEMLGILWMYAHGEKVSPEGKKQAKAQLLRIARMIPALAIFLLPGGFFLLPVLAKALPWDLLPTPFRDQGLNPGSSMAKGPLEAPQEKAPDHLAN